MSEIKDQFTLDGRIKPANHMVTRRKVEAADKLLQAAFHGDKIAAGKLAEVHTTSDLKFNIAHLITAVALPQFDAAPRTWDQVATTRTVPDFGPVRMQTLSAQISGAGVVAGPAADGSPVQGITGGLPVVPEATPYPYVTIEGQEAFYAKIAKMGAKFGFAWEAGVNDVVGFFEQIPAELVELALDTEEREVFQALINGTTNHTTTQATPDGQTIPADAVLTPDSIWAAILQLQNTVVGGRRVGRATGYNVVVAPGVKEFIDFRLGQRIIQIQDGLVTLGPGDRGALANVTVVESVYLTGSQWIVLPKPGALRRPVLELLRLRGHEQPELRVHGDTGQYVGGAAVSPFEGNFSNDTIDYRIRYVAGGALWSSSYSVISDGTAPIPTP